MWHFLRFFFFLKTLSVNLKLSRLRNWSDSRELKENVSFMNTTQSSLRQNYFIFKSKTPLFQLFSVYFQNKISNKKIPDRDSSPGAHRSHCSAKIEEIVFFSIWTQRFSLESEGKRAGHQKGSFSYCITLQTIFRRGLINTTRQKHFPQWKHYWTPLKFRIFICKTLYLKNM